VFIDRLLPVVSLVVADGTLLVVRSDQ
jgi:hypothetical protein